MAGIPLQQIDWDLVGNLYGTYRKSRQEQEREEMARALHLQQLRLLQMQIEEKQQEKQYEEGMLPYLQQEEARIRATGAGVEPPKPMLVEPQGPPPPESMLPSTELPGLTIPPTGKTGLEPYYKPPSYQDILGYEKKMQDATPNRYEILSQYALKGGKPKEALAYAEMAAPQRVAKIDSLLKMAVDAGDAAMYHNLLSERRMLEDQIAITEKKYTEREMEAGKTQAVLGKKEIKGLVDVGGGMRLPYAVDSMGNGFVQKPDGKWVPHTATGQIEPLTEERAGQSPFAKYYQLFKSQGLSEEEAVFKAHKAVEESLIRVGNTRIPSGTMDPRLPPGFSFDRRTKQWMYDTPDGARPVPPGTPMALIGANHQANLQAYKTIRTDYSRVKASLNTAMINADNLIAAAKKYGQGQYPPLNKMQQYIDENWGSRQTQEELRNFRQALWAFSREFARTATGAARSAAELHAASQEKIDNVLSKFVDWKVLEGNLVQAKRELAAVDVGYVNAMNEAANNLDYQPWRDAPSLPANIPEKSEYEGLLERTKGSPPPFSGKEEGDIYDNRTKGQSWIWRGGRWEPYFGKKQQ